VEIAPIFVPSGSPLAGKSLAELDLRNKTGLTLLAIRRDSELMTDLDAQTKGIGLDSPGLTRMPMLASYDCDVWRNTTSVRRQASGSASAAKRSRPPLSFHRDAQLFKSHV
jgi:hypothetical protein